MEEVGGGSAIDGRREYVGSPAGRAGGGPEGRAGGDDDEAVLVVGESTVAEKPRWPPLPPSPPWPPSPPSPSLVADALLGAGVAMP